MPLLAAAAVGLLVSACATGPVIRTRMAVGANLSDVHTFAFVAKPGTDRGPYKSLTTQWLEADVAQQMRSRGYAQAASGQTPDLLIDFRISTHDRVVGGPGPAFAGGYWGWGPYGWGGWGGPPGWGWPYGWGWGWGGGYYDNARTVTSAALTISVINRTDRAVVWSGTAVSDLGQSMQDHPEQTLGRAVTEIFAHYPVAAR